MNSRKLNLEEITVKSFITRLSDGKDETVKGGYTADTCTPNETDPPYCPPDTDPKICNSNNGCTHFAGEAGSFS